MLLDGHPNKNVSAHAVSASEPQQKQPAFASLNRKFSALDGGKVTAFRDPFSPSTHHYLFLQRYESFGEKNRLEGKRASEVSLLRGS